MLIDSIDSDNSDFEFENDDSSSEEEDDEVLVLYYTPGKDLPQRKISRITNYIDVTINKHKAHEFKTQFR